MPAAYSDQFIEQGTTFNTVITVNDNVGRPFDFTGFTMRSQARKSYYSNTVMMTFNATPYNGNKGAILLTADASVTANVPPGKLVYDVVVTETASGAITRVVEGQIFVSPGVTK
jgi:hypothetical protein